MTVFSNMKKNSTVDQHHPEHRTINEQLKRIKEQLGNFAHEDEHKDHSSTDSSNSESTDTNTDQKANDDSSSTTTSTSDLCSKHREEHIKKQREKRHGHHDHHAHTTTTSDVIDGDLGFIKKKIVKKVDKIIACYETKLEACQRENKNLEKLLHESQKKNEKYQEKNKTLP